jgi:hypothetical protein
MSDDARDPAAIQREIEETQARLSETLDRIQDRLAPRQLMDQAYDMIRNTTSDTASNVGGLVRDNAIPLTLIGAGLAWLMWSTTGGSDTVRDAAGRVGRQSRGLTSRARDTWNDARDTVTRTASDLADQAGDLAGRVRGRADDTASSLQDRTQDASGSASGYRDRAAGYARNAGDQARGYGQSAVDYGRGALDQARDYGGAVQDRAREYNENFWDMIDEHPLVAGVMGLALGAAIGATIPASSYEEEWLGDIGERMWEQGRQYGSDAVERVTEVARSAVQAGTEAARNAATEEAREQGLVSADGGDKQDRGQQGGQGGGQGQGQGQGQGRDQPNQPRRT